MFYDKKKKGTLTNLRPNLPFYAMTNYTHLCWVVAWLPFQKNNFSYLRTKVPCLNQPMHLTSTNNFWWQYFASILNKMSGQLQTLLHSDAFWVGHHSPPPPPPPLWDRMDKNEQNERTLWSKQIFCVRCNCNRKLGLMGRSLCMSPPCFSYKFFLCCYPFTLGRSLIYSLFMFHIDLWYRNERYTTR